MTPQTSCDHLLDESMADSYQQQVDAILHHAGVTINGPQPWDIQVFDNRLFKRIIAEGELGVGESYMDGWWDAGQLDEFICRVLRAELDAQVQFAWPVILHLGLARLMNRQSRRRAFIIGKRHYDLGNDLFIRMLDKRMNYSSAYWEQAQTLDEAQERKLDLICRKLGLRRGMRVLDIGCGWGAFGKFAAERFGVEVVGVTVSQNQVELGRTMCQGLPVEFRLMDYRAITGSFDRIVSVGMIEHVGYKNYRTYCTVAHRCLTDDGLFLLHTIGGNRSVKSSNPWTDRYIFPNGMLPSMAQLTDALEGLFILEDWQSLGPHYDRTLLAWYDNITSRWSEIRDCYDDRFFRMWKFFLLSSAGAFRARRNQVWQLVLSKRGLTGGYAPSR